MSYTPNLFLLRLRCIFNFLIFQFFNFSTLQFFCPSIFQSFYFSLFTLSEAKSVFAHSKISVKNILKNLQEKKNVFIFAISFGAFVYTQ